MFIFTCIHRAAGTECELNTHIGRCIHARTHKHTVIRLLSILAYQKVWPLISATGFAGSLLTTHKKYKGMGGIKVKRQGKGQYMCVSVHACVCKIACVLGDSDFKNRTPCCAAITFKGRRVAQTALFLLFMKFLLQGFIRKDALGTVCSLLCPGCDSGLER